MRPSPSFPFLKIHPCGAPSHLWEWYYLPLHLSYAWLTAQRQKLRAPGDTLAQGHTRRQDGLACPGAFLSPALWGREVLSSVPLGPPRPPVFHKQPEQFRMSGPPYPEAHCPSPQLGRARAKSPALCQVVGGCWWPSFQWDWQVSGSQAPLLPSWGKIRVPDSAPTRPPSPCSLSSSRHPHSPARDPDSLQPSSPPTPQPASSQE